VPLKHVPCTIALLFVAGLGGCNKSKSAKEAPKADLTVPNKAANFDRFTDLSKAGKTVGKAGANPLQQPFLEAVLLEPPDENELLPPEKTVAGRSVGKMFEAIAGHNGVGGFWDKIALATPDGKLIRYSANLITDLGTITIELWPDVAPNHVRNFIALAKVGYYNGLGFDLAVHQKVEGDANTYLEYLEAGCPLGTGEPGYGSIGYWLKPEFSDKVHEVGTIGACHGESLESAAAKFYITLGHVPCPGAVGGEAARSAAPWLDGNWTVFGKITQGLDVARTIFQRPVDEDFSPKDRVLIREVTIQSQ